MKGPTPRAAILHVDPAVVDALIAALADRPVNRRQWARAARVRIEAQRKEAAHGK